MIEPVLASTNDYIYASTVNPTKLAKRDDGSPRAVVSTVPTDLIADLTDRSLGQRGWLRNDLTDQFVEISNVETTTTATAVSTPRPSETSTESPSVKPTASAQSDTPSVPDPASLSSALAPADESSTVDYTESQPIIRPSIPPPPPPIPPPPPSTPPPRSLELDPLPPPPPPPPPPPLDLPTVQPSSSSKPSKPATRSVDVGAELLNEIRNFTLSRKLRSTVSGDRVVSSLGVESNDSGRIDLMLQQRRAAMGYKSGSGGIGDILRRSYQNRSINGTEESMDRLETDDDENDEDEDPTAFD